MYFSPSKRNKVVVDSFLQATSFWYDVRCGHPKIVIIDVENFQPFFSNIQPYFSSCLVSLVKYFVKDVLCEGEVS